MSDMAEYWQDRKEKDQKKRAEQLKWNTEVVLFIAGEYEFEVKQHNATHFSLYHPERGRLDYWPSTGKARWVNNKKARQPFHIPDIEKYLQKHFKN